MTEGGSAFEKDKIGFFGQGYYSEENYGVPGGYKAYDRDGFWRKTLEGIKRHATYPGINFDHDRHLDLGCAYGHLLKRSPFKHVVGADISGHALHIAQTELDEAGKPSDILVQLDADFHLPFQPESFGCITALDIVEHTRDRQKTIKELARLMKEGGVLIVGTPITDTLEGKVWGKYLDKDASHVSKPSRAELFRDLENAGFEVLEYHYYFPLPFAKVGLPRTNIEIVARKTSMSPSALRESHIRNFPKDRFLREKSD